MLRFVPALLFAIASATIAGCGNGCSVSGRVTFENAPVKDGWIQFTPADGKGPIASAPIKDGRYSIGDLLPGSKIVNITASPAIQHASTTAEMAELAKKG